MGDTLPYDFSQFADPNAGRQDVNDKLSFDPFFGSPEGQPTLMHPKEYDHIVGLAWMAEHVFGKEAANRFLQENGIRPFPEA